ncbi:unnamed protein product [Dovyalis caffra]|uniref:Protein kinase domain-containing protein n=1 Tax=Dovyalis caffra TaxID=77055 RepID=A0AAV1S4C6_9ROSI|nr:unnamed protein product [Dovyalis caffra]
MEIGRGRFGVVYKAELANQINLAVKKISPQSKQQDKDELKSEIGNLISLSHENLEQTRQQNLIGDLDLISASELLKAGRLHTEGMILRLVDKKLASRYDNKQALTVLNLAMRCINLSPTLRPSMSEVVTILTES